MARMFGTDGVRGVAGSELTIELATKLGQAGAYVLTKEQEHQATIIVGCDTRISGGMLDECEADQAEGLGTDQPDSPPVEHQSGSHPA